MEIKKYFGWFAVVVLLLHSCKKETDLSYSLYPVVAGYLSPGKEVKIRVTYQKGPADTAAYGLPLSGLSISVANGTATKVLSEKKEGVYTLDDSSFVTGSGIYSFSFEYMGKLVTAQTVMPAKPRKISSSANELVVQDFGFGNPPPDEFATVRLSWDNPDDKNHLVFMEYMEPAKVAINSFFTRDTVSNVEINAVKASFIDIQQMNFRYIGRYRIILASVNAEYLELLEGSGNSSQNLTNPPTNVKNGFGIFTAMQMDTLAVPFVVRRE